MLFFIALKIGLSLSSSSSQLIGVALGLVDSAPMSNQSAPACLNSSTFFLAPQIRL
jgi:hypothetical protein